MTPVAAEREQSADPRTSRGASDIFVVSNLGQIRTAALVSRQLDEVVEPHLMVLWTAGNRELLRRMLGLAEEVAVPATAVRLAGAPNAPLPARMRRMVDIIDRLPGALWAPRLWVSNANSFYGYLAHTYAAAGSSINLFEEGLGSYRGHFDPPFAREPVARRAHELSINIRSVVRSEGLGRYRKVRRVAHHSARFLFSTKVGRRLNTALVPQAPLFADPWTAFDRALLAFPEAADPVLVRAARMQRLELEPDREQIAVRDRSTAAVPIAEPLFLSQRYGVPYGPWAEAITAELRARGITRIALKNHPRETSRERADLMLAFLEAGLAVRADPIFDGWTAEALIVESGVENVLGITSSTLVYRPYAPWHVTYTSIGRAVLDRLTRDPRVPRGALIQLTGDVRLLERVMPTVEKR